MLDQRALPGIRLLMLREGLDVHNAPDLADALRRLLALVQTGISTTYEGCEVYASPPWQKVK